MTLTACILTQNNEATISSTLLSISQLCDEIVIIDCLSQDETRSIAEKFTDKIYAIEFYNDYSIVRNMGIQNSTGDYILILNGDETVDSSSLLELKNHLSHNPNCFGAYFKECDIQNNEVIHSSISLRVFRNSKRFKYTGRLNEQIVPSIKECVTSTSLLLGEYNLYRNHDEISHSASLAKLNLHKKVLECYLEDEKDWFYFKGFGDLYFYYGDHINSAKYYNFALTLESFPFDIYLGAPDLIINLILSYIKMNMYDEGLNLYSNYCDSFKDFRELHFLGFICAYFINEYSRAKTIFNIYTICDSNDIFYPFSNVEEGYNIDKILYEIEVNCFIESHLELMETQNLIIVLICNGNTFNNEDLLYKTSKLNCEKIIFTPFYLTNKDYLIHKYNLSICKYDYDNKGSNSNMLNFLLTKLSYIIKGDKNKWILMLYENEGLSMNSLAIISSVIKNQEGLCGVTVPICSHSGKITNEIRLFKYSENLFYETNELSSLNLSFEGEYGINKCKDLNIIE